MEILRRNESISREDLEVESGKPDRGARDQVPRILSPGSPVGFPSFSFQITYTGVLLLGLKTMLCHPPWPHVAQQILCPRHQPCGLKPQPMACCTCCFGRERQSWLTRLHPGSPIRAASKEDSAAPR
jgi:hypothetical protein